MAVEVPGDSTEYIGKIARDNSVHLVVGVIEREGGTLYCTALFFSPEGMLLGKHRKLMPTAMERVIWGMGDGSTMPVLPTRVGKIGSVICWENYMPLLRTAMYAKGIELLPERSLTSTLSVTTRVPTCSNSKSMNGR